MSEKIQKIRQEIERLKTKNEIVLDKEYTQENKWHKIGAYDTCFQLSNFIDSLPEEPASEDLEEEIDNYIKDNFFGSGSMGFFSNRTKQELNSIDVANIARHFAEWGRNHFEDKSEMVSEETTIVNDWQYGKDPDYAIIPAIHQRIDGFNVGDIVKIIIVKEDYQ